ncbi:MAG: pectate lyase [Chitinophagaceae bacterium]
MKTKMIVLLAACAWLSSCAAQNKTVVPPGGEAVAIAFPGAEGFGKYTTGGRGGKVMVVTNLDDKGPGSFREAVEAKGKRIVVFALSGTIHLETKLLIKSDVTVAGQTAPGDGICLADQPVSLNGDNIIVRYLRFRMGDKYQQGGMVDGNGSDDAFGGVRRKHIIIDHCSMSWSTDEVCSVYAGDSTTLQWNIIAEPLNYSYHFEKGDKDYEHHGFGGIWGGRHLSAHHNLFAHCNNRNPRFDGTRNSPEENVDYRNNVIYDWGINNVYAGEGGQYNLVNNYYKYGPSTSKSSQYRIVSPGKWEKPAIPYGRFYVDGNYVDGAPDVTQNNRLGVKMDKDATDAEKAAVIADAAFAIVPVSTEAAKDAYESVLRQAGASYRRDTLDARIVQEVRTRTGRFIDVQGGFPHGTAYELTLSAWPALRALPAPADTDRDGMPDEWEKKNKLNAGDAADAAAYTLHQQYTNVEVYINSLVSTHK